MNEEMRQHIDNAIADYVEVDYNICNGYFSEDED